jgi:hypothetical protein
MEKLSSHKTVESGDYQSDLFLLEPFKNVLPVENQPDSRRGVHQAGPGSEYSVKDFFEGCNTSKNPSNPIQLPLNFKLTDHQGNDGELIDGSAFWLSQEITLQMSH